MLQNNKVIIILNKGNFTLYDTRNLGILYLKYNVARKIIQAWQDL